MRSVTRTESGLVAVGAVGHDQSGWDAAVWRSPDGTSWIQTAMYPGIEQGSSTTYDRMYSVAVGEAGVVAVGREHIFDMFDAAIWVDQ